MDIVDDKANELYVTTRRGRMKGDEKCGRNVNMGQVMANVEIYVV
jgi:hypothetical protein